MAWSLYRLTGSLAAAVTLTLVSQLPTTFAFSADAWGIAGFNQARAAYLVLPVLVLALTFWLQERRRTLAFVLAGLCAWVHPVTGYHLAAVLFAVTAGDDLHLRQFRWRVWLLRAGAFLLGAAPTLVSVFRNGLYSGGAGVADPQPPALVYDAMTRVIPPYVHHVLPDALASLPWPRASKPLFVAALASLILAALLAAFLLLRDGSAASIERNTKHQRLWCAVFVPAAGLLLLLLGSGGPMGGGRPAWWLLLGLMAGGLAIYGLGVWRNGVTRLDGHLLALLAGALLFSLAGSWAINAVLEARGAPLRFLEQIRGVRIAWWIGLVQVSLAFSRPLPWRLPKYALACLAGLFLAVSLRGLWLQSRVAPSQDDIDRSALATWATTTHPAAATKAWARVNVKLMASYE